METVETPAIDADAFEPKTFGELLGLAVRHWTSNSGAVLITVAVLALPMAVLQLIGAYLMTEWGVMELQEQMQAARQGGALPGDWLGTMIKVWVFQGLSAIVMVVTLYFAAAGAARIIGERALGRDPGPAAAWDFLMGVMFRMIGGGIVQLLVFGVAAAICAVIVGVASVALVAALGGPQALQDNQIVIQVVSGVLFGIPFAAIGTYLVAMPAASANEGRGGFGAIGRSFGLVSGNFLKTFGAILVSMVVVGAPCGVLQWLSTKTFPNALEASMGENEAAVVAAIPFVVVSLVLMPLMYSLQGVIYLDLRSRQREESFTPADLAFDMGYGLPPDQLPEPPLAAGPAADLSVPPESPSGAEPFS